MDPKKKLPQRPPLDWGALKQEFIATYENVREFALNRNLKLSRVYKQSIKDMWIEDRVRIQDAALKKAEKKTEANLTARWEDQIKLWRGLQHVLARKIKHALEEGGDMTISAGDVRNLAAALKDALLSQRLIHGESTENVEQRSVSLTLVDIVEKIEKGEL